MIRRLFPSTTEADADTIRLCIRDRDGGDVLSLSASMTLLDVSLTPGTYHVLADWSAIHRHYTVAIAASRSVDVYLSADDSQAGLP